MQLRVGAGPQRPRDLLRAAREPPGLDGLLRGVAGAGELAEAEVRLDTAEEQRHDGAARPGRPGDAEAALDVAQGRREALEHRLGPGEEVEGLDVRAERGVVERVDEDGGLVGVGAGGGETTDGGVARGEDGEGLGPERAVAGEPGQLERLGPEGARADEVELVEPVDREQQRQVRGVRAARIGERLAGGDEPAARLGRPPFPLLHPRAGDLEADAALGRGVRGQIARLDERRAALGQPAGGGERAGAALEEVEAAGGRAGRTGSSRSAAAYQRAAVAGARPAQSRAASSKRAMAASSPWRAACSAWRARAEGDAWRAVRAAAARACAAIRQPAPAAS